MKKWTALLVAMLMVLAMMLPALASETDLAATAPDDEEFVVDESAGAEDMFAEEGEAAEANDQADVETVEAEDDSEWLYADDEDAESVYDEEYGDEEGYDDALAAADDGAPITQVNEDDQEDLLAAMEVYSWFALMPLDYDEGFPNADETKWRVLDERFNTPELMKDMLSFYFADEIVDELWNSSTNPYETIDGYLYTDGEGREMDDNLGETFIDVTNKTDDTINLTATVQYVEPTEDGKTEESFDYVRKLIDGEWKYTEFPFFW